MTTRDYEKIAEVIRNSEIFADDNWNQDTWNQRMVLVDEFATMLLKDNPRFNEQKFVEACGIVT